METFFLGSKSITRFPGANRIDTAANGWITDFIIQAALASGGQRSKQEWTSFSALRGLDQTQPPQY